MTIAQTTCERCGGPVFDNQYECTYCHAPLGHQVAQTEQRSPLPTTAVAYPPRPRTNRQYRQRFAALQNAFQINGDRLYAEAVARITPDTSNLTNELVIGELWRKYMTPGWYYDDWHCWWAPDYVDGQPRLRLYWEMYVWREVMEYPQGCATRVNRRFLINSGTWPERITV